ncbi:FAD-binding oxidoreductase [Lentzea sp. BCCO 10_0798]|uniref:FAD-binding oxidoreductase n=1 Tax=Lentzea kristufekii TaxID=3095430 RepID=A0ABU4TS37_9PSEU|nr:FAD-binding oxidoreductase [Lentzea sp. BCCO 10_0798]MDX8051098.1 FAD-binding oxidoreductase [Lentzea sp. BCCO 10_0798]
MSALVGRSTMDVQLIRPGDAAYRDAKLGHFTQYDAQRPSTIARVVSPADVQRCIEIARQERTKITARCGGHSYPGYSTADGALVVDVRGLNRIDVRPDGTAEVGAGVLLMDLYLALANAGRMMPAGTCATVGISGLTLGGGIGVTARQFGLTSDRLVSTRIVTPDGVHRTVSATEHADLFWALRGGGGGNFGIVTSFVFRTEPARNLTTFTLQFPSAALASLLGVWPDWQGTAPDALTSTVGVGSGSTPHVEVGGCLVGTPANLRPLLDDLVRRVGSQPTSRRETEQSFLAAMERFAWCRVSDGSCRPSWNGGGGSQSRGSYVATSRMLTKPITDPQKLADIFKNTPNSYNMIDALGGAVGRGPATAFPHRSALASIQVELSLQAGEANARRAMGVARDELGRMFGATGYVNYIDPQMPDWANAYYGSSLTRLREVARKYDPDRVFAFPQSLAS